MKYSRGYVLSKTAYFKLGWTGTQALHINSVRPTKISANFHTVVKLYTKIYVPQTAPNQFHLLSIE